MGELTGTNNVDQHQTNAAADNDIQGDGFATEVPGVNATAFKQIGTEKYPVFSVGKSEFYQNMTHGRKRVRFSSDSPAANYLRGMKYNKDFYISYTDPVSKETWTRKVK